MSAALRHIGIAVCFSLVASAGHAEDTPLVERDGIAITIPSDMVCGASLKLTARAADMAAFRSPAMAQAVDGARVALGFKCPEVRDVMILGYAGSEAGYGAVASAASAWALVEIPVSFALEVVNKPAMVTSPEVAAPLAPVSPTPPTQVAIPLAPAPPAAPPGAGAPPAQDPASSLAKLALPPAPGAAASPSSHIAQSPAAAAPPVGIEQFKDVQQRAAQARFPTDDYNFSALMAAIFSGDTKTVPDDIETRKVVFSVLSTMAENCGAMSISMERSAAIYVSPELGNAIFNGSYDDVADQGFKILEQMLTGIANGPAGLVNMAEQRAVLVVEGQEDGRNLVRATACTGNQYRAFQDHIQQLVRNRSNNSPSAFDKVAYSTMMSPRMRDRLSLPDPSVAMRDRQVAAQTEGAAKACKTSFSNATFCDCAVGRLRTASLSDDQWKGIGVNFHAVAKISELREPLRSCSK